MRTIQRAFVSYSSSDVDIAKSVADACEKAGAEVFFDQRSLEPSAAWYDTLKTNLASADTIFVIVSESALKSRYVNQEIGMAQQAGAMVVPLFLTPREGLPPEIGSLQGESIIGLAGSELLDLISRLLAGTERLAVDLPPTLGKLLDAKDARTKSALLAVLPAALGSTGSRSPFLPPTLRDVGHGVLNACCNWWRGISTTDHSINCPDKT